MATAMQCQRHANSVISFETATARLQRGPRTTVDLENLCHATATKLMQFDPVANVQIFSLNNGRTKVNRKNNKVAGSSQGTVPKIRTVLRGKLREQ